SDRLRGRHSEAGPQPRIAQELLGGRCALGGLAGPCSGVAGSTGGVGLRSGRRGVGRSAAPPSVCLRGCGSGSPGHLRPERRGQGGSHTGEL
ncbi:uncharacterized protein METZ01_LOCUS473203, partial [marine metagenome]